MTELEKLANEAVRRGTTYGKLVAKIEKTEERKAKKKEKKKEKKIPGEIIPSEPVAVQRTLKQGWTPKMVEEWREVRRLFGR